MSVDELQQLSIFSHIDVSELDWVRANSRVVTVDSGDVFFRQDEPISGFYIVLDGEMQVTRYQMGHEMVMGTTPRGVMGGEIPILDGTLISSVTSTALSPTRLMVFDVPSFRQIFAFAPTLGARIMATAAERMGNIASGRRQQEKMNALGKLASGLAHELNNPASAARRAAVSLRGVLYDLQSQAIQLPNTGLSDLQVRELLSIQQDAIRSGGSEPLSPLEHSDRENAIAEWLEANGVNNVWKMAASFVDVGVTADDLDALIGGLRLQDPTTMLTWLCTAFGVAGLVHELEQSTRRISDLVEKVKGYTYMDEAPIQEIDLHAGLENTLSMLHTRIGNRIVIKQFDKTIPRISARGSELNQVWTNLLDNAIEATADDGTIHFITRNENAFAMIEINDDGAGISDEVQQRMWEPFYTTKDAAQHTGLGLDIVFRIITQHDGTMEARPEPGKTRFILRLPIKGAE
ncbi:MAG: ATP-binding protein [Chloroflexota bacterium]|nr:ATP-binding protein [Chloroflexota bacterium]